jgi:preprotein translocase subunit YajC
VSETFGSGWGFYVGQEVVTRRGKRGTVVAVSGDFDTGTVDVSFNGKVFTMTQKQVVSARAMQSRKQRQYHDR